MCRVLAKAHRVWGSATRLRQRFPSCPALARFVPNARNLANRLMAAMHGAPSMARESDPIALLLAARPVTARTTPLVRRRGEELKRTTESPFPCNAEASRSIAKHQVVRFVCVPAAFIDPLPRLWIGLADVELFAGVCGSPCSSEEHRYITLPGVLRTTRMKLVLGAGPIR